MHEHKMIVKKKKVIMCAIHRRKIDAITFIPSFNNNLVILKMFVAKCSVNPMSTQIVAELIDTFMNNNIQSKN